MKSIKNLALMFAAIIIAMQLNAQTAKATVAKQEGKAKTEAKAETKAAKPTTTSAKPAETAQKVKAVKTETKTVEKTAKKPADARTKTGDKVFHDKKGPNGETVYVGPKGGFYYLDKKENKVYIK